MNYSTMTNREQARQLLSERALAVSIRFEFAGGAKRDVTYDGTHDVEMPQDAESFVMWAHPLRRADDQDESAGRASPIEGPISTLRDRGIDATALLVLQRADLRLG